MCLERRVREKRRRGGHYIADSERNGWCGGVSSHERGTYGESIQNGRTQRSLSPVMQKNKLAHLLPFTRDAEEAMRRLRRCAAAG